VGGAVTSVDIQVISFIAFFANWLVENLFSCSEVFLDISEVLCAEFSVAAFVSLQIASSFEFLSSYFLFYRFLIILATRMLVLRW
jgi:hypothetical protein